MPVLRYQNPSSGVQFIELAGKPVTIGRGKDCDLRIDDTMSSRAHAQVKYSNGHFILVDLKSKNGTYVNGSPISTWQLKDGDLISIGNSSILFKEGR